MLAAALAYARRGWNVFPCHWPVTPREVGDGVIDCSCGKPKGKGDGRCGSRGKHPRTFAGCKDATRSEMQIRWWWEQAPHANVGVACGADSNLFVLDVDPPHGGDATLKALEERHGSLPATLRARTGSGGEHIFFNHIPDLSNSIGALGSGLDTRTGGGYVVAAPSLHGSGRRYEWIDPTAPIADAPAWLANMTVGPDADATPGGGQVGYWQRIARGVREGERHFLIVKLSGLLLGTRRIDPILALSLVRGFNATCCKPPLDERDVDERFSRVLKRQARHE